MAIVEFQDRTFSNLKAPPPLTFAPVRYGWNKRGGPATAEISALGNPDAMWQLFTWLRYGVMLYNDYGAGVWWGYVHEVVIALGALKISVTLDRLVNRVKVAHTINTAGAGGGEQRLTTAWAQDDESVTQYGYRELIASMSDTSTAMAEARRAYILARRAGPRRRVDPGISSGDAQASATLLCRGWWQSLGWRYYSNTGSDGSTSYTAEPEDTTAQWGDTITTQRVSQGFILPGSGQYEITKLELKAVRVGAPADNVIVDIYTGNGNAPGTLLYSATLGAATLNTAHTWTTWTFASQVRLTAGTQYCMVVRRSGGADPVNYFRIAANSAAGYASGLSRMFNGTTWVTYNSTEQDLLFRISAQRVVETSQQIADMVASSGQFITGVDVDVASGLYSVQYRDGDSKALKLIEKLIDGNTSTGAEMLATVTPDRRLVLSAEPTQGIGDYYLTSSGRLLSPMYGPVEPSQPIVGVYAQLMDVPAAAATTVEQGAYIDFIDAMEYVVAGRTATYQLRDSVAALDELLGVKDG